MEVWRRVERGGVNCSGAMSALEYLALPMQLSIFVGGIVGFKGTLWVDRMISKKVGEES